jgi:hypothetical protein
MVDVHEDFLLLALQVPKSLLDFQQHRASALAFPLRIHQATWFSRNCCERVGFWHFDYQSDYLKLIGELADLKCRHLWILLEMLASPLEFSAPK